MTPKYCIYKNNEKIMTVLALILELALNFKQVPATFLHDVGKFPIVSTLSESNPYNPPDNGGPKTTQGSGTR